MMTQDRAASHACQSVSLICDAQLGQPAAHGMCVLQKVLAAQDVRIVAGEGGHSACITLIIGLAHGEGAAARALVERGIVAPEEAESLCVCWLDGELRRRLLVCGADDRGLMYALLDLADRIGWADAGSAPFAHVHDMREAPAVAERALSKFTMHRAYLESHFHSPRYWARYFDILARNRFNRFVLIFGYECDGLFAPAYPYFCSVKGFEHVRVVGQTAEQQARNLESLNKIIAMAHARGLDVTLGLWDHIYRGGVQGDDTLTRQPTPGLVWGLTPENLAAYSCAALAEFLGCVEGVDTLQFRMHGESGLSRQEMPVFWKGLFEVMRNHAPDVRVDARAKEFPDDLIDLALGMGLNFRICTKYWAEQMGLPYHPTHINRKNQHDRRHGYADLLRYPQRYTVHWRMFNGGTTRILLWGDPEYARRFAQSSQLYGGQGFEVNEPLATKMLGQPHDREPSALLTPPYQHTEYEFERYWYFYKVFGRLGYNPETPAVVWERAFEERFRPEVAPHVMHGLHRASQVLPRIVATSLPPLLFPLTRGWPERQRWESFETYCQSEPSDTQIFASFTEAARNTMEGIDSAKVTPAAVSAWFQRAATDIMAHVAAAEAAGTDRGAELTVTLTDLRILAKLAMYHSWRGLAGLGWALYTESGDLHAYDATLCHFARAIHAWRDLIVAAGDVYSDELDMGLLRENLAGHWRDELPMLEAELAQLQERRETAMPEATDKSPVIRHVPVRRAAPGQDLVVGATVAAYGQFRDVSVVYEVGGQSRQRSMSSTGPGLYQAVIPGEDVAPGLAYRVEVVDQDGGRCTYPESGEALLVTVAADREPPTVDIECVPPARIDQPVTIRAHVRDAAGIKWVRLLYRPMNQMLDYCPLPMMPTGEPDVYAATIPAEAIDPAYDLMILIESMDRAGNGCIHPDFEREAPYIIIPLVR